MKKDTHRPMVLTPYHPIVILGQLTAIAPSTMTKDMSILSAMMKDDVLFLMNITT